MECKAAWIHYLCCQILYYCWILRPDTNTNQHSEDTHHSEWLASSFPGTELLCRCYNPGLRGNYAFKLHWPDSLTNWADQVGRLIGHKEGVLLGRRGVCLSHQPIRSNGSLEIRSYCNRNVSPSSEKAAVKRIDLSTPKAAGLSCLHRQQQGSWEDVSTVFHRWERWDGLLVVAMLLLGVLQLQCQAACFLVLY